MSQITTRVAWPDDAPAITACVCEAYVHHIKRVGKQPWPMLEDHRRWHANVASTPCIWPHTS